jgi:2,5-furandicarboxylate decarboxylase 1
MVLPGLAARPQTSKTMSETPLSPATAEMHRPGRQPITRLRDWLDHLAAKNRLAVVRPGSALTFEVAAIAKRLDGTKATLFPSPDQHPVPVVSGLISDRAWMAEAMGVGPDEVIGTFQAAALAPVPWTELDTGPAQNVVHHDVDLKRLMPMPTHNEHDSGPYITAGLLITRNPQTGVQNVAIHRLQLIEPNRLGVLLLPRHTMAFYEMAVEVGHDLEVAIVVGVDPLTLLASQAILSLDADELEVAGALHGKPLDVVKCVTNNVRVPADSEFVLEGRILAHERELEGPFGEFPQYYGERAKRHVIEIDAVTHRKTPIFHTIVGGGLEHLLLGAIPREATMLAHLQRSFPSVLDVHLARGGVCRYHLYVKMKKRSEGEAKNVILGAFAGHYDIKQVIVVDEDVDIHNPTEVEWAVATRFQADRDLVVIGNSQGSKLDPSTRDGVGAKMGLDATVPLEAPEFRFKRIRVPGERELELASVLDDVSAVQAWRERLADPP